MSVTEKDVINMALAKVGLRRINDFTKDNSAEAIYGRMYYSQTRDALLRSFEWPFASARKTLAPEVNSPDFEWSYKFKLPDDYLRLKSDYGIDDSYDVDARFTIEGNYYLTNNDEVDLRYIKKVTNPDDFDPLFTEVLILTLAKKLIPTPAGTKSPTLLLDVGRDLADALSYARTVCRQEVNTSGRSDWRQARHSIDASKA